MAQFAITDMLLYRLNLRHVKYRINLIQTVKEHGQRIRDYNTLVPTMHSRQIWQRDCILWGVGLAWSMWPSG